MMKLSEMNVRSLPKLQQRALMRLQLRFTSETHRLYGALGEKLAAAVTAGGVDAVALGRVLALASTEWRALQSEWGRLFERAREQAAGIPFGALVVRHNFYLRGMALPVTEAYNPANPLPAADAATMTAHWQALRQRTLDNAAARIYSDNFSLSGRIWRLEADGLDTIRRTLAGALATQTSATELARLLTANLGAGEDCPRWAYGRLYGMTSAERAKSTAGLRSGSPCEAKGLAYNALRLARNEIQIAHQRMNDDLFRVSPWITGEHVRLSATHPKPDECDDAANGGPYEPGKITLPLHVQCMCYKEAVLMPVDDFRRQVRGWLAGDNNFLDEYRDWSGFDPLAQLPWVMSLADALELWLGQDADGHAEALGI